MTIVIAGPRTRTQCT